MKNLIFLIFLVFSYFNYRHLNLGFLQNYSLDEYAFHGSLLNMYEGLISFDVRKFFSFHFYSYGFSFFFLNLLATLPFFATDNIEMTIYIPRLISSIFAISSLYLVYKIAKEYLDRTSSIIISLIIVSMPGFWVNAFWFHPDWMMVFFILLTIFFFLKDNWKNDKYFWLGSISFGLAIASKIQAVTFIPFIFLYVFYDNIKNTNIIKFFFRIRIFTKALSLSLLVFIFANPYIIHPKGFNAFVLSFLENLESNSTNHGTAGILTISDKINNAIYYYYVDKFIFVFLILISLFLLFKIFKKEDNRNLLNLVAAYFLINIGYLLIFVNKDWNHYYLPIFTVAPLLFISLVREYKKIKYYILSGLIIIQVVTHITEYKIVFSKENFIQNYKTGKMTPEKMILISDLLIIDLKKYLTNDTNILMQAYIPFDYLSAGLTYQNIEIIYGPLRKSLFDREDYLENANFKDPTKFKEKKFIILSKDSVYFKEEYLKKIHNKREYIEAIKIVNNFMSNGNFGYKKFKENEYFIIFKKNNRT
jgi:hypothetical protein